MCRLRHNTQYAPYGVASISRLLKIISLFCKRALQKRRYSAKETYIFKEPTNRSHPIESYPSATIWVWMSHIKYVTSRIRSHIIHMRGSSIYVYMCTYMGIYTCICICIQIYELWKYAYIYIYINVRICIRIYICVVRLYMYTRIHI